MLKFVYVILQMSPFATVSTLLIFLQPSRMFCGTHFQAVWRIFEKIWRFKTSETETGWNTCIFLLVCHKAPDRLLRGSVGSVVALWRALCMTGSNKPRLTKAYNADSFCTTLFFCSLKLKVVEEIFCTFSSFKAHIN